MTDLYRSDTTSVFLWENFGPLHADRCDAVAKDGSHVVGLELFGTSDTYDWIPENGSNFRKITMFPEGRPRGWPLLRALIGFRRQQGRARWFLCHYDWAEIFLFASYLRMRGDLVFTMGCSKFDDMARSPRREWLKSWFLAPYLGAIGSGVRSRDYFRFLGVPQVVGEYNTVRLDRVRTLAGMDAAPGGTPFDQRHFTIVARLVAKKNLTMALRAYAIYCNIDPAPRGLHLCGSGPLEAELRNLVAELRLADKVVFHGFIQTDAVAEKLANTLVLILPSLEEQFGNVVPEAQALGLPVILSDACGARDLLVRSGVNGFVIEPDNPEGLAFFMALLARDQALWQAMSLATEVRAPKGDVGRFVEAVTALTASG